jgi:hypothetical protein
LQLLEIAGVVAGIVAALITVVRFLGISKIQDLVRGSSHPKSILRPGETLGMGESLISRSGSYELRMQGDGNLVAYRDGMRPVWASKTDGHPGATATMQEDGNLVIYLSNSPIFASKTDGNPGSILRIQNDGNIVIYKDKTPIWKNGAVLLPRPVGLQ